MTIQACRELDADRPRLSLDGRWEFAYDPRRIGRRERWFAPEHALPERIRVPGCAQARHYASAAGAPAPFHGLPELEAGTMLRFPCSHDAWFKRRFRVPGAWQGQRIRLCIGGVLPVAEFWINGRRLGQTASSRSPLRSDVTRDIACDGGNTLTVRVTHGSRALSGVFDIIGWSGIYRSIWLEAVPQPSLADIAVHTGIAPASASFTVRLEGRLPELRRCRVNVDIKGVRCKGCYAATVALKGLRGERELAVRVPMPDARLWSPDAPHLYAATIRLLDGGRVVDSAAVRFGLREIRTEGFKVLLNGTPVFLRGACDDHYYPATVCPPADKRFFATRIRLAKRYGFNYTKSCVEVFTREFLDAADELGYLVCQEMPFGILGQSREARFDPPAWLRATCRRELRNIVTASANHPSVVVYSMSSELHQGWLNNAASFRLFSRDLPGLTRALAPGALVFDCTGASDNTWGCRLAVPVRTKAGTRDTDLEGSWLLWNQECEPLLGPMPGLDGTTRPFVCHEYCWFTALSEPGLVERLRRLPVVPLHVPEMVAAARRNGQAAELPRMVECSRRLKYALRKHALELARLEPKAAGYHHWLVHDFPFCAEGVFNEFWEPPRDLSAAAFRQCNADTVLCLADGGRRCFTHGETPRLALVVSHFGAEGLWRPVLTWRLTARGCAVAAGRARLPAIPPGARVRTAALRVRLGGGADPVELRLETELREGGRRIATNAWTLWSFPAAPRDGIRTPFATTLSGLVSACPGAELVPTAPAAAGGRPLVTAALTDDVLGFLRRGGRVLLLAPAASQGRDLRRGEGATRYRTVPYNMGTTGNMGTVIRPHPALGRFPHDGWCDFVGEPLIEGAAPFSLQPFHPRRIRPIIRSIGHMRTLEDKAYLFEANVGRGRLVACALRLADRLGRYPAADYLLAAMLRYLAGERLAPAAPISPRRLRAARG